MVTLKLNSHVIECVLAQKGLSKKMLAERSGISRQNISTIIRRGTCEPKTAGKIAAGLEVEIKDIVEV